MAALGRFPCGGSSASSERVGLLQQDARPDPSHRLRPQGVIEASLVYENTRGLMPPGIFYAQASAGTVRDSAPA